jgi:hypothetical protein
MQSRIHDSRRSLALLRQRVAKFVESEVLPDFRFLATEFRFAVASWTAFVTNPIARGARWLSSRLRPNVARASTPSPNVPILASASTKAAAGAPRPDLEPKPRPDLATAPRPKPAFTPKPVFEPAPEPAPEPEPALEPAPASASAPVPLAARALSPSAVDHLLAYAIATETRLLFFREDVIVFAGERCSLDRIPELKAARLQLADRIEDLFGVDVPGSTGDVADREARAARAAERAAARARRRSSAAEVAANARTERPTDFESDRDWSPPQELVLAPWEVDAESIPPRREHERGRSCDADGSRGAAPAPDAADRAAANPTPPLPSPRDSAPDPNIPPRQDDSTASQETPQ